jgi:hypothetical protein
LPRGDVDDCAREGADDSGVGGGGDHRCRPDQRWRPANVQSRVFNKNKISRPLLASNWLATCPCMKKLTGSIILRCVVSCASLV